MPVEERSADARSERDAQRASREECDGVYAMRVMREAARGGGAAAARRENARCSASDVASRRA